MQHPQPAGTVRADAEVQTRAGCGGGGGWKEAKNQLAEITMFQISEVQESPAFNGRRSFLTLRAGHQLSISRDRSFTERLSELTSLSTPRLMRNVRLPERS